MTRWVKSSDQFEVRWPAISSISTDLFGSKAVQWPAVPMVGKMNAQVEGRRWAAPRPSAHRSALSCLNPVSHGRFSAWRTGSDRGGAAYSDVCGVWHLVRLDGWRLAIGAAWRSARIAAVSKPDGVLRCVKARAPALIVMVAKVGEDSVPAPTPVDNAPAALDTT